MLIRLRSTSFSAGYNSSVTIGFRTLTLALAVALVAGCYMAASNNAKDYGGILGGEPTRSVAKSTSPIFAPPAPKVPESIVSTTVADFTKSFSDNQLRAEEYWKSNQARMYGKVKGVTSSGNTVVVVLEGGGWFSPDFYFEYDESWKGYASQLHRDQQVMLTGLWQGSSWGRETFKGTGLQW